ncbi:hypothetical protein AXG93_3792s1000 [Marchantia polymorpha subsp. ruderalis]|uniref:Uncharacterized protein n=1 Tax=Marchantia polymorpha subsp. ruderalis TaxID=1480154 RepID=A0A176WFK8_MARPO|nr:hypothetical protein AXG93_3792s1000 [Marchantia polymorpha subsp. ruderalis]
MPSAQAEETAFGADAYRGDFAADIQSSRHEHLCHRKNDLVTLYAFGVLEWLRERHQPPRGFDHIRRGGSVGASAIFLAITQQSGKREVEQSQREVPAALVRHRANHKLSSRPKQKARKLVLPTSSADTRRAAAPASVPAMEKYLASEQVPFEDSTLDKEPSAQAPSA